MNNITLKSKPHYPILDGLRGVAALMVAFHIFEAHATSHLDR
jgi:peptidoglycan/LPS O-acetylase OafA/YrhL